MALKHSVYDTDTHFSINPITRALQNESHSKTSLIQYDHNSERFTFEIPRYIEGHDMSQCDSIQVHYNNINANTKEQSRGMYEVDDMQISPEDDNVVILSWLISHNATKHVGSLNFLVRFACTNAEGKIVYAWNTAVYSGISVSTGINNSEVIVEEYADILAQWEARITALEKAQATSARISNVTILADKWVGDASPYSQIVTVDGATENSQVDLTPSVEQLAIFYQKDLAFVTENEDGVVTVYAIGQKPENDYTIQVTITEVTA